MVRAVRSSSSSSGALAAAIASLLLAGCAASAPELPPDTTSVNRTHTATLDDFSQEDRALSCEQIGAERRHIADDMQAANGRIEANRTRNQVAGYVGALTGVGWLATDNNDDDKDQITKLYGRQDTLIKLAGVKNCPTTP
jgi:outer membrane murein-binding lipoprotein Lpp